MDAWGCAMGEERASLHRVLIWGWFYGTMPVWRPVCPCVICCLPIGKDERKSNLMQNV